MLFMMLGMTVSALAQETLEITGTVTDAKGEPIIGANVSKRMIRDLELSPMPMDIIK